MWLSLLLAVAASPCDEPGLVGGLNAVSRPEVLRVADGAAQLRIGVVFSAPAGEPLQHGEGRAVIALPEGTSAVVGSTLETDAGRVPLTIQEAFDADNAVDRFRDALSIGVPRAEQRSGRQRTAAVVALTDGGIEVRVVNACSNRRVRVTLQVLLASAPVDGAWRFFIPRPESEAPAPWSVPLQVDAGDAEVLVDGDAAAAHAVWAGDDFAAVDVRPRSGPQLRGRAGLARLTPREAPLEPGEAQDPSLPHLLPVDVLRAELDLPRPLASAPSGLHLVFVVDASVSAGDAGVAMAWRVVDAILDHAPADAHWAAVAVGRRARVVVPAWRERDQRSVPQLEVQNGSDVAEALRVARALAGDLDEHAVGRVILLSDLAGPSGMRPLGVVLRNAPLTHVVQMPEDADVDEAIQWQRVLADDGGADDVAAVEATGGIFIVTTGDEDVHALAAHLIAPTRIDAPRLMEGAQPLLLDELVRDVRIGAEGAVEDDDTLPERLYGGSGVRAEIVVPRAPRRPLALEGMIWGQRVSLPLVRAAQVDRAALALAAAGEVSEDLQDPLVRDAALQVGAVSRVTSLAHVPRWRPGVDELPGIAGYACGCGCGMGTRGFGSTRCGMRCAGGSVDLREVETLQALLREDLQACSLERATLDVEVHDLEILEVGSTSEAGRCVVERFWTHRLDLLATGSVRVAGAFETRKVLHVEASTRE